MLATAKRCGGATDPRRGGLPMRHWFAKAAMEADNGTASLEIHVSSGGGIAFWKGRRTSRRRAAGTYAADSSTRARTRRRTLLSDEKVGQAHRRRPGHVERGDQDPPASREDCAGGASGGPGRTGTYRNWICGFSHLHRRSVESNFPVSRSQSSRGVSPERDRDCSAIGRRQ